MITIKELSEKIGKSKTSIYNMINKNNLETLKRDGKTYLTDGAEQALTAYYSIEQQETLKDLAEENENFFEEKEKDVESNGINIELVELLKEQLRIKDEQLNEKEKSLQALIQAFNATTQQQTARLIADHQDKFTDISPEITPQPQKGFWSKFFKK